MIWVGNLFGVVPTLALLLLGGIVGARLVKSAGMSLAEALRSPVQTRVPLKGLGGPAAARAVSGLLFMIPGFVSDALALLLFLPSVRRWIASKFRVSYVAPGTPKDPRFGPVIEVEAIEISGEVEPPRARED